MCVSEWGARSNEERIWKVVSTNGVVLILMWKDTPPVLCIKFICALYTQYSLRVANEEVIIFKKERERGRDHCVMRVSPPPPKLRRTDYCLGMSVATLFAAHIVYKGWVVYQYSKRIQAYTRIFIAHSLSLLQHTPHNILTPSSPGPIFFILAPFIIISLRMGVQFLYQPFYQFELILFHFLKIFFWHFTRYWVIFNIQKQQQQRRRRRRQK